MMKCDAALGRVSVACGSARMPSTAVDSPIETTTAELSIDNADDSSVNITEPQENDKEFLPTDHFGKITTICPP